MSPFQGDLYEVDRRVRALILAVPAAQAQQDAYITANRTWALLYYRTTPAVSPYSSYGALNPYTKAGGKIYAQDGTTWGA
jgi:hypothetical protein